MRRVLAAGGLTLVMGIAPAAEAAGRTKVIERTVALVGERPILLSELRHRMTFAPGERAPRMLERMIEERIIEVEADQLAMTVSPEEVDDEIRATGAGSHHPRRGMSEQDFRDEIRRHVLHRKWLDARVIPLVVLVPGTTVETVRTRIIDEGKREVGVEVFL